LSVIPLVPANKVSRRLDECHVNVIDAGRRASWRFLTSNGVSDCMSCGWGDARSSA